MPQYGFTFNSSVMKSGFEDAAKLKEDFKYLIEIAEECAFDINYND